MQEAFKFWIKFNLSWSKGSGLRKAYVGSDTKKVTSHYDAYLCLHVISES